MKNRLLELERSLHARSPIIDKPRRKRQNGTAVSAGMSAPHKKRIYSRPFYGTGEHVLSGQVEEMPVGRGFTLDVNGVPFAYSELIAMGDLYETADEMLRAPTAELTRIQKLIAKSARYYTARIAGSTPPNRNTSDNEWQSATNDRYLKLAEDNFSHFAPSSSDVIPGFTSTRKNNKSEWEHYHSRAVTMARQSVNSTGLEDALVINAFGDHFLTDAFSAGHLFNKDDLNKKFKSRVLTSGGALNADGDYMFKKIAEKAFTGELKASFSKYETYEPYDAWWNVFNWNPNIHTTDRFEALLKGIMKAEPDLIGNSLVAKLVHDALNEAGVKVMDNNGNHWELTGDTTLNQFNLDVMRVAVTQSIRNVVEAASHPSATTVPYSAVWDFTPRPTTAGKNQIKDIIEQYTNPRSSVLIQKAAGLLQENFQKLITEMVKRNVLKKA